MGDAEEMYLHIGSNKLIRKSAVIGIFDADTSTVSATTRKFLSECERRGEVEAANGELPKSFVLYGAREKGYRICFSQISSAVLKGRSEHPDL